MADASKPKRPSRSKKAPEPDFSSFEDWLIDGPAGEWPDPWDSEAEYSEKQKQIVADNARDLENKEAWLKKVHSFEEALSALVDDAQRKQTRGNYLIRFDCHVFADGRKEFWNYPFPCSVSFYEAMFVCEAVSFGGAKFSDGDVSFDSANFGTAIVWFGGAKFGDGTVSFDGAKFGGANVSFGGAEFGDGDVRFEDVTFGDSNVSFDAATFGKGNVSFYGASFGNGDASFDGVQFGEGDVLFAATIFGAGNLTLDKARFGIGEVSFYEVSMRTTDAIATGVTVAGNLYFEDNECGQFDFSQLQVEGTASFSGSSFDKVPDLRDAKFDRPPEVAGMVVPRPKLDGWNSLATDPDDVTKFRKLKAMALAANDHEKDGEFFAGEMLAKRGVETTGFFGLLFNTLYWWLSDFGQSYLRPLMWMLASYLGFGLVYLWIIGYRDAVWERLAFAASLSARNAIPLLGSLYRFASAPEGHVSAFQKTYHALAAEGVAVDWLIRLGVIQSIISAVLLFLFLLALRNKFRLK